MEKTAPHSAADRQIHWGPVAAVAVTVIVFFAAQICAGVVVSLYPSIRGWSASQREAWLTGAVDSQFLAILVTEATTIWLVWKFLQSRKARWADIGLVRPRAHDIWTAAKGYTVYFACFLGLSLFMERFVTGINLEQEQQIGFTKAGNTSPELAVIFLSLVILPPIAEEVLCRGFLYTGLRSKFTVAVSALLTSALFAAAHLQFGSGMALLWVAAADTFVLSLVLVYVRERSGSLWPAICIHTFKNLVAFLILFVFHTV